MRIRMLPAVLMLALAALVAATTSPASAASPSVAAHTASAKKVPSGYYDWVTYHGDRARSGHDAGLKTFNGTLAVTKRITLDGAVYGSPIVAKGITIVATENNTVYAFGLGWKLLWKHHLATPVSQSQLPCGDINPLGITGTPVYYAPTGLVYVAAELSIHGHPWHRVYGLRLNNGSTAFQRGLDLPGVDKSAMQERGALTVSTGRVWVPFGGLAGDCGSYKGRLVGYSLTGGGSAISYTVPTQREAGIWTTPGPSVDSSGTMYVAVGNGAAGVGDAYDYSDSVLKVTGNAKLADHFSPRSWATDNENDLDLGSQGPALVGDWIFTAGKSGNAYVLRRNHLDGVGGQVSTASICRSFGGTAVYSNVVYVPCTDGVRAVRIDSAGTMHVLWHAASNITGSPVVGGGIVWSLDTGSGTLHALDPWTGADKKSVSVGPVTHFTTPALSGNRILVGTQNGIVAIGL